MDVYQEAVQYLESEHVPVEAEADVLEEDVFQEEACLSPLPSESIDFPDTPVTRRKCWIGGSVVLKGIMESEEVYLSELEALLMPMKALWASAGTSQPVLSSRQVQTVFYQVPELRDMHQSFYTGLKERLSAECQTGSSPGEEKEMTHKALS
ncbi:Breakpoint cluster region protein [Larimichthys crocea]|uniref:Uncharacterized protein n=1 Tax=Larimichthys crocea TaxID=215358 RepID=A0ACD3Q6W1_LARCR|nr:Breakpoint cluster region protein [Larimichthys crocea]